MTGKKLHRRPASFTNSRYFTRSSAVLLTITRLCSTGYKSNCLRLLIGLGISEPVEMLVFDQI